MKATAPTPDNTKTIQTKTRLAAAMFVALGISAASTVDAAVEAVIVGDDCETGNCDAAFRVDLTTGRRILLSSYTAEDSKLSAYDPLSKDRGATNWKHIVVENSGRIIFSAFSKYFELSGPNPETYSGHALYTIDPASGTRRFHSGLQNPDLGPVFSALNGPVDMALLPSGKLVASKGYTINAICLIDTSSALRKQLVAGFTGSLASEPTGNFISYGPNAESGIAEEIREFNLSSGTNSIISQNKLSTDSRALTVDSAGRIFVVTGLGFNTSYSLSIVDRSTGIPTVISDFGDLAQGPLLTKPVALAVDSSGRILALDDGKPNDGGGIYAIDPDTGVRTVVSDFLNTAQGPQVWNPRDLAVGNMPAFVGSGEEAPTASNHASSGVNQSESADPVRVNELYRYTITFTNAGGSDASNVKLADTLPKQSKLSSAVASQGRCKGKARVVCNFGSVAAGATVTAEISLTARKAGTLKNKALITYKAAKVGTKKKKLFKATSTITTTVIP